MRGAIDVADERSPGCDRSPEDGCGADQIGARDGARGIDGASFCRTDASVRDRDCRAERARQCVFLPEAVRAVVRDRAGGGSFRRVELAVGEEDERYPAERPRLRKRIACQSRVVGASLEVRDRLRELEVPEPLETFTEVDQSERPVVVELRRDSTGTRGLTASFGEPKALEGVFGETRVHEGLEASFETTGLGEE